MPVETFSCQDTIFTIPPGEQLETKYQVHELPSESEAKSDAPLCSAQPLDFPSQSPEVSKHHSACQD